jgi:hypothetical protein
VLGVNGTKVQHNGQIGVFGYLGATVVMGSRTTASPVSSV